MPDELQAARPGRAGRWHVRVDIGGAPFTACRPVLIAEHTTRNAADVEPELRCKRAGCRKLWPARWIRITDIGTAPALTPDQRVELTARSMTELAAAQALVLIHGTRRGGERYVQLGGTIRFDDDGEPIILVRDLEVKRDG